MSSAPPAQINVTINGTPHAFPRGTLIVEAVRQVGHPIPFYCYHPKLAPVGACRVCMVQVEGAPVAPRGPIVTTGCTTPVFEGLKIETMSEPAKLARKQVLEFLLINHPLDCPVCDKGGECDLQDFTLGYGPGVSGFAEQKIHRKKADDLGPFLVLDQERCILCQRCVRYEQEVLGEQNLVLKQRGDHTVIETGSGEPYAGYFSGNNTELCPVGALTSRTYRFKARPWDVRPVPTVCQGCAVGCNATVHLRNDAIVRLLARDNPQIDGGWLCDRGRYGFGHTTAQTRLTAPLLKKDGTLAPVTWDEAVAAVVEGFRSGVGVLGGGRLLDEEAALLRSLFPASHVDWRVGYQTFAAPESIGLTGAQIADIDAADLVLLVDTSLLEEAPVLEIRLRRAAAQRTAVVDLGPVKNFRLGRSTRVACAREELPARLAELTPRVTAAQKPLVVWNGRGGAPLAEALRALGAPLLVPGEFNNARGAEAAGLGAGSAKDILEAAAAGRVQALYLVGANPLRTYPDGALAAAALDQVGFLVVQDLFLTEAAQRADVVLPALGPLEKAGHVTNLAGTTQQVARAVAGPAGALADGAIFRRIAAAMGSALAAKAPQAVTVTLPTPAVPSAGRGLRLVLRTSLYAGGGTAAFDPNLSKVGEEMVLRMHPADAAEHRLADGAVVHVRSAGITLRAVVRQDRGVVPGHLWAPAHVFGANLLGATVTLEPAPVEAVSAG